MKSFMEFINRIRHRVSIMDESRCWIVRGDGDHYAKTRIDGKYDYIHRLMYEHINGQIPEGKFVCHTCDDRHCVNPDHLFLGTQAENLADMRRKGRGSKPPMHKGADQWNAKLTPEIVAQIRAAPTGYGTGLALARKFGISNSAISMIRLGKAWKPA